jgi:hypothetical protein
MGLHGLFVTGTPLPLTFTFKRWNVVTLQRVEANRKSWKHVWGKNNSEKYGLLGCNAVQFGRRSRSFEGPYGLHPQGWNISLGSPCSLLLAGFFLGFLPEPYEAMFLRNVGDFYRAAWPYNAEGRALWRFIQYSPAWSWFLKISAPNYRVTNTHISITIRLCYPLTMRVEARSCILCTLKTWHNFLESLTVGPGIPKFNVSQN